MRFGFRIGAVALVLFALSASASDIQWQEYACAYGNGSYDAFGSAVAPVPDVNGDGIDDGIAGAPGGSCAFVFSGADGSTIHTLKGDGGDDFGTSVAAIPDLNSDGVADVIVGAPQSDYAIVFSGSDGSEIHRVKGLNGGEYFGTAVAGIDDADGDKLGDFAVGAPFGYDSNWNQTGYVVLYSGKSGKALHTFYGVKNDEFGCSVAGGADANGDGYGDVAVGSQTGVDQSGNLTGNVTVWSGLKGDMIAAFYGDTDWSYFGASVALAGDVNADKYPDLLVGAPSEPSESGSYGMVRVISGADGSTIHTLYAGKNEDGLGFSVASLGDLDGDGYDDFAAGSPDMLDESGTWTGGVRAFSGAKGDPLFALSGARDGDQFGASICLLRDLDGDGADDLAVGAPGYDEAGEDAGCVFLLVRKSVPSGTVSINDGAPYTNSPDVTLTITWSSPGAEVTQMRVRNAGEDWGDWGDPQETVSWTLTSGDGSKNVEVEFLDAGGGSAVVGSDPILLDTTPPSGTLTLQGGAAWTNTTEVTVGAAFTDAGSGVWQVSLRNQGGAWGSWFDPASPPSWTLTAGEGAKIVEAQCMDGAGNVSTPASDSIGLDQTAPSGTILIEGGAEFTNVRDVTVTLSASDSDGSGLASMRLKLATGIFDAWVPYATSALFTLPSGDGVKGIDAQFLDVAGNVSSLASDTILLDRTAPTLTSFTVNGGNQYVLPSEPVLLQIVASDGSPSSGVAGFRTTFDNGATYGPWTAYGTDPVATDHPATGGLIPIRVMLRDNAGNVSGLSTAQNVLFIEVGLPHLLSGGSFTGTMDDGNDIDALTLDLTKDDLVGMKLKKSPALAGAAFPLVFDLCRSNGERVLTGVASIAAFVAPATDRYYLVARQEGGAAGPGYYNFKLSVKMAKTAAKAKAVVTTGEFTFEAAAGSSLKLGLKGPGLDPASVTVVGPDGALAAPAAGKTGSAKLAAVLDKGTGVYTITFTATGPVKLSLSLKLPKGTAVVEP